MRKIDKVQLKLFNDLFKDYIDSKTGNMSQVASELANYTNIVYRNEILLTGLKSKNLLEGFDDYEDCATSSVSSYGCGHMTWKLEKKTKKLSLECIIKCMSDTEFAQRCEAVEKSFKRSISNTILSYEQNISEYGEHGKKRREKLDKMQREAVNVPDITEKTITELENHKQVERVYVSFDSVSHVPLLCILTKEIKKDDKVIGQFFIRIYAGGNIVARNLTKITGGATSVKYSYLDHWAIKDGSICQGTYKNEILQYFNKGDFFSLMDTILSLLELTTDRDTFCSVQDWFRIAKKITAKKTMYIFEGIVDFDTSILKDKVIKVIENETMLPLNGGKPVENKEYSVVDISKNIMVLTADKKLYQTNISNVMDLV